MNCCGQIVLVEETLLAPSGEEYDRCARRSVSLEHVRDRPFVIAVTNFDQPYSFMSAQRAIEAVFLGYYVDEQYAEAEAGTNEQDSPEHRNRFCRKAKLHKLASKGQRRLEGRRLQKLARPR